MTTLYREKQKFNQWWLWLLLLLTAGMSAFAGYTEYVSTGSWSGIIGGLIAIFAALVPMALLEMRTTITKEGIVVAFWPFAKWRIAREDIAEASVRTYSPLGEYGGWGIRGGASGRAYNVSGNQGLQLRLHNGKKILIGTQQAELLAEFIRHYLREEELELLEWEALQAQKASLLRGR